MIKPEERVDLVKLLVGGKQVDDMADQMSDCIDVFTGRDIDFFNQLLVWMLLAEGPEMMSESKLYAVCQLANHVEASVDIFRPLLDLDRGEVRGPLIEYLDELADIASR